MDISGAEWVDRDVLLPPLPSGLTTGRVFADASKVPSTRVVVNTLVDSDDEGDSDDKGQSNRDALEALPGAVVVAEFVDCDEVLPFE